MPYTEKNSDISKVVADFRHLQTSIATLEYDLHIVGYNSKKLPDAAKNYFIAALDLFGLVTNIYPFRELIPHVHFECYFEF